MTVGEMDRYYQELWGIKTKNIDKYIGLINHYLGDQVLFDINRWKYSKVLKMKEIESMPQTYQYFHKRVKQITSQFDQDGVIQAIFQLIGTRDKFFVEVGGGSVMDNTFYLRSVKGWDGHLLNFGLYFMGWAAKDT